MRRPNRLRAGVLALMALAVLGLVVAMARSSLSDQDELTSHLKARLAAWTGSELVINGQTAIAIFPRTRIEVGDVVILAPPHMAGLRRLEVKRLRAEFDVWSLLWGEPRIGRLTLFEPKFSVQRESAKGARPVQGSGDGELVRLLREAPFGRITIEQGVLDVAGPSAVETITNIQTNTTLSQTGAMTSEGAFKWRGETVTFELQSDAPTITADTATSPLRITIGGNLITASIAGEATLAEGIRLSGSLNLALPHTRKFSRWMGVDIPEGTGLGAFSATGDFNWSRGRIAFDNGTYVLDGNRAIGALAILFDKSRPEIDGTLALQTLNLNQYLPQPAASDGEAATASSISLDLTFPLMQHFDVDLRVSATEFQALPIEAGQTALTLALKSGALSADFSILDLFGGRSAGRLEIDTGKMPPDLRLSGTLTGLTAQAGIEAFSLESPIQGAVDVEINVAGRGRSVDAWLEDVSGTLALSMAAGSLDFNLTKVVDETRKGDVRGWSAARGGVTNFDSFTAEFSLDHGIAASKTFELATPTAKITGAGSIDIPKARLEWRIELPNDDDGPVPQIEASVAGLTHSLHIQGPWSEPTFHLEQKRAEDAVPKGRHASRRSDSRAF